MHEIVRKHSLSLPRSDLIEYIQIGYFYNTIYILYSLHSKNANRIFAAKKKGIIL